MHLSLLRSKHHECQHKICIYSYNSKVKDKTRHELFLRVTHTWHFAEFLRGPYVPHPRIIVVTFDDKGFLFLSALTRQHIRTQASSTSEREVEIARIFWCFNNFVAVEEVNGMKVLILQHMEHRYTRKDAVGVRVNLSRSKLGSVEEIISQELEWESRY